MSSKFEIQLDKETITLGENIMSVFRDIQENGIPVFFGETEINKEQRLHSIHIHLTDTHVVLKNLELDHVRETPIAFFDRPNFFKEVVGFLKQLESLDSDYSTIVPPILRAIEEEVGYDLETLEWELSEDKKSMNVYHLDQTTQTIDHIGIEPATLKILILNYIRRNDEVPEETE